jgi:hypothetical protein
MRFMILVKSPENCGPIPPACLEAIALAGEQTREAGALIESGGLASTSKGARVRLSGGKVTVTDGPFAELKEVVGGYGIVEASSKEEALKGAVALITLHQQHWPGWEGEVEVRQILGPEDFRS